MHCSKYIGLFPGIFIPVPDIFTLWSLSPPLAHDASSLHLVTAGQSGITPSCGTGGGVGVLVATPATTLGVGVFVEAAGGVVGVGVCVSAITWELVVKEKSKDNSRVYIRSLLDKFIR